MNTGDVVGKDRGEQIVDTGRCANGPCGNHVYVLESQYDRLVESGETFYCPIGHGQSFTARKVVDERLKRAEEAERAAARERERRAAAEHRADLASRTCPWPTCEGRLLASAKGLRQHLVKSHGAPWSAGELTADEVAQVLNGRDPVEVVK